MTKYILIIQFILAGVIIPQQADSLIQVYPGIGDTLNLFNRTYIGLFPEVKNFDYAVFYISNKDSLVTKIYYSANDTTKETVRVQNILSYDSIYTIIRAINSINYELRKLRNNIYFETKEGNWIEGQLEMFDEKYIYVLSANVRADHVGQMRYRIPVSSINWLTIEGESYTLMGMLTGSAAGGIIGAIAYSLIRKKQDGSSLKSCTADADNAATALAVCAGITLGGFLIGTIIGSSQSTDDNVIYFETDMDVLKLSGYSYYVLDKEMLNERKYFDIY